MTWFLSSAVSKAKVAATLSAVVLFKAAAVVAQKVTSSTGAAEQNANNGDWSNTNIGIGVAAVFALVAAGAIYCLRNGYTKEYVKGMYEARNSYSEQRNHWLRTYKPNEPLHPIIPIPADNDLELQAQKMTASASCCPKLRI